MNPVIETIMNHRSIRRFKDESLTVEQVDILVKAAQMAPTSNGMQSYSIIGVTDNNLKKELKAITNMDYVEKNGHLFIFCADLYRFTITASAEEKNKMETLLESNIFYQIAVTDAALAAQNAVLAAESLGLGTVYIGAIVNNYPKVDQLLQLPPYVLPIFGLAIGFPDQQPEIKPRLPQEAVYFENQYNKEQKDFIQKYDEQMNNYYQTRAENQRQDTWSRKNIAMLQSNFPANILSQFIKEKGLNKG